MCGVPFVYQAKRYSQIVFVAQFLNFDSDTRDVLNTPRNLLIMSRGE